MVHCSPDLVAVCDLRQETVVGGSDETLSKFRGDVVLCQQATSTSGTSSQRFLAFLYFLNATGTLTMYYTKLRVAYNNGYREILELVKSDNASDIFVVNNLVKNVNTHYRIIESASSVFINNFGFLAKGT